MIFITLCDTIVSVSAIYCGYAVIACIKGIELRLRDVVKKLGLKYVVMVLLVMLFTTVLFIIFKTIITPFIPQQYPIQYYPTPYHEYLVKRLCPTIPDIIASILTIPMNVHLYMYIVRHYLMKVLKMYHA